MRSQIALSASLMRQPEKNAAENRKNYKKMSFLIRHRPPSVMILTQSRKY
jgi:hypothetical protein